MADRLKSDKVRAPASLAGLIRLFEGRGWSDGLPIIPPTEDGVLKMLAGTDRDAQELVGVLPPRWGECTIEKIAVNAVMAGCLPEYLPVIIAAVEAVADPRFNLFAVQTTTHPCGTLMIVSGPIRQQLKINGGPNAFGPGWRANATIGRALRLVLLNVGGGIPGRTDMATQGQPGKFSFCFGENEDESPWEPLHVERGFSPEASTVTVAAAEGPHNINDHGSTTGLGILKTMGDMMATIGSNNMLGGGEAILAIGPEHAATISEDGFTKDRVKDYIFRNARVPLGRFPKSNRPLTMEADASLDTLVPVVEREEDLIVVVAGGAGKHSSWLPTFGGSTRSVTREI